MVQSMILWYMFFSTISTGSLDVIWIQQRNMSFNLGSFVARFVESTGTPPGRWSHTTFQQDNSYRTVHMLTGVIDPAGSAAAQPSQGMVMLCEIPGLSVEGSVDRGLKN